MKLELHIKVDTDTDNEAALLKTRAEANQVVTMVDFALGQRKNTTNSGLSGINRVFHHSSGPMDLNVRAEYRPIMDIIDRLPMEFSTSDVIVGLGENGKRDRPLAKGAITDAINRNVIRLVEAGKGRRPSRYAKAH
jgi:hypothetical protein